MVLMMILAIVFATQIVQLVVDIYFDHKHAVNDGNLHDFSYYANLPSDVNIVELWALFFGGAMLHMSYFWLVIVLLIQAVICILSMWSRLRNRRMYWYNWV